MFKLKPKQEYNLNIFYTYTLVTIITGLVFYPLFPVFLNYPPDSTNTPFNWEYSHIPYWIQYTVIILLVMTIGFIFIKFAFRGIDKWKYITRILESNNIDEIKKLREKSLKMPNLVYILQILFPLLLVYILFQVLGFSNSADIKFFMILTTFLTLAASISYLFSKKYFREVLRYTYINDVEIKTTRNGLRSKVFLQILPLFLLSILFTTFIGQSGLVKAKGDALFERYLSKLKMTFTTEKKYSEADIHRLLEKLQIDKKEAIYFYIDKNGNYQTSNGSVLSEFLLRYTDKLAFKHGGHTYDYYGSDVQGAVIKCPGVDGRWIVGVRYVVISSEINTQFTLSFLALLILAVFILLYFAKTMSDDITTIASGLTEMAEREEVNLNNKIAVTSSDEIGDLAVAFNKVREREKKYIQDIKEQQKIIMERERLVSLGQMLGGITHNLKSPVASIAGFIDRLEELAVELEDTAADESVTAEDRLDIVKDLKNDLDEMKPYCSYISNLLSMVKEKAFQLNTSTDQSFTIAEVQARIMLLMNFELKNNNSVLKTEIKLDPQSIIKGEINNLVQVINNIILNSIQAYEDQGGAIDLTIEKRENNKIVFTITDYASGIPEDVQKKLLQEMVTTKGAKGSGLGLYLSRLTIKGRFGGDLLFKSKVGEGSTFSVIIPFQPGEESIHG